MRSTNSCIPDILTVYLYINLQLNLFLNLLNYKRIYWEVYGRFAGAVLPVYYKQIRRQVLNRFTARVPSRFQADSQAGLW